MVVGEDVAARIDNKPRAQCLANAIAALFFALTIRAPAPAEEPIEEVLHVVLVPGAAIPVAVRRALAWTALQWRPPPAARAGRMP